MILDGEEEVGSPYLPDAIDRYRDLLEADLMLIIDGPRHPSDAPTVVFGARGIPDEVRPLLDAVPDYEPRRMHELAIGAPDSVGTSLQTALQYPSLNVRGMASAWVGEDVRTRDRKSNGPPASQARAPA